jgi:hypothetical protein
MKKIFIFTCLLLLGCKQVSKEPIMSEMIFEGSCEKKITINDLDENAVLKYSDIFDDIQFVKLETRDDNLIGRIDKIIATDDKFIILDMAIAKRVFVFDRTGKFLNAVGSSGGGPEEYDTPDDIAYDEYNDELLVWCHNKTAIMKFKPDGTFVKNINIDYRGASIQVAGKDSFLIYLNNYIQKDGKINDYNILIIDGNGKTRSRLFPYNRNLIAMSPPAKNSFCTFQKELLFSPHYSNIIFKIDPDSAIIRNKYCFDFGEHNIPPSLFEHTVTPKEFEKAVRGNGSYAFNISFIETASHTVNLFVYKRKIFTCIHSKESGITKFSAVFLNDVNSLFTGGVFCTQHNNMLIGYIETEEIAELQKVAKKVSESPGNIKDVLLKKMGIPAFPFGNKLRDNYVKAVKSSAITLSENEINFINSITETDNPVIKIAILKKF